MTCISCWGMLNEYCEGQWRYHWCPWGYIDAWIHTRLGPLQIRCCGSDHHIRIFWQSHSCSEIRSSVTPINGFLSHMLFCGSAWSGVFVVVVPWSRVCIYDMTIGVSTLYNFVYCLYWMLRFCILDVWIIMCRFS